MLDLEKGVLLRLFPIFQEMLLCLLSTLSRNWAFDRCIKTRDTGAAEPYPLTMPHAQRETGSTMQFAEISDNWRHTGKWVAMTQVCDQTAAEVTHRAQQYLDSVILDLSDLRGFFQP